MLSIGQCVQLACIWEATARKPGNVHRYCDFADTTYLDFTMSAAAIAPVLKLAADQPVGETILEAVRATRRLVAGNTNLGIILCLAPLAAVPRGEPLETGVEAVLASLTQEDSRAVFQAIRLAHPGGLGTAPSEDVADEPTQDLRSIMALAAQRDTIALQYANGFQEVFTNGIPALEQGLIRAGSLEHAIVYCFLSLLSQIPDTLIARKLSRTEAEEASRRAGAILQAGWPEEPGAWASFAELDAWLRAQGHQRNPGTTADLVAACLFVLLREARITVPLTLPWSAGWNHG